MLLSGSETPFDGVVEAITVPAYTLLHIRLVKRRRFQSTELNVCGMTNGEDEEQVCFKQYLYVRRPFLSVPHRVECGVSECRQFIPVLDASGKYEPGILVGRRIFSGLYSECVAIDVEIPGRRQHLKGGYGRLFFDARFRDYRDKTLYKDDAENYEFLAYDVCLPKSCSNDADLLKLGRRTNSLEEFKTLQDRSTQILINAYFGVDTFFFLSGLLASFVWFREYNRNEKQQMSRIAWIMFYVHRYIRLTPPYYLMIAFYSFVFLTFTKNMPNVLSPLHDSCEKNWWINFLYLNNYIDYGNQCYSISWYLATDLQMYIFAPVLLVPLAIKPIIGFIVAGVILCASVAANMATVYALYLPPSPYPLGVMDPRMKNNKQYTLLIADSPWIHCQIYITGMLIGYLLQTKKRLHINKVVNIVLWIISLAIGAYLMVSLKDWTDGKLLSLTERAFYSAFSKIAWGLALSYVTVACFYGYGGPISQFMSWSVWIPCSRLTYCSYLLHQCIVHYVVGMRNVPLTYTNFSFIFVSIVLPAAMLTYFFAIFWSALFEISTRRVEMLFLGGLRCRRAESATSQDSENTEIMTGCGHVLPRPPSHAPPEPPVSVPPEQPAWELTQAKRALYKLFKRNEYKSYKPQPVGETQQNGISSDRKEQTERAEVLNVAKGLQNQATGNDDNKGSMREAHRRRKERRDFVATPADGDWS
ncbi:unnamed protein product [Anisakis simplex]|uniref:NRF domain-containing protein n=1 Tax=Anisakis simplex TaxID=6269 RepID=A0A158PNH4_ANISI|nr:unnamed protein product [Anisakis simplex]